MASIINISVEGEDLVKETEFLNKLCENYIQNDLNTKNEFLKTQLILLTNNYLKSKIL